MKRTKVLLFTLLLSLITSSISLAATVTVDLVIESLNKTMPDSAVVPMWGMRLASAPAGSATVPGPVISAIAGDTLVINLTNNLTAEPVSLVINGQTPTTMIPTWTDGTTGPRGGDVSKRVRSFTHEAAAYDAGTATPGTATYEWSNLKAGTYLLTSGTHPAVQVPMGLYAAVRVDAVPGQAYSDSATTYAGEAVLLFSEIDPELNSAVAGGTYGTSEFPTALAVRSEPKYFLINGSPFSASPSVLPVAGAGQKTLLRFLNAGSHSRVPVLQNEYMQLIADDGQLLPGASEVYSIELAAGKRYDAIIQPVAAGVLSIHDRTGGMAGDGMLAYLGVDTITVPTADKIGVLRSGRWYLDGNGNGVWNADTDLVFPFGQIGDLQVAGDWNGDGVDQIGVYRAGKWYLDGDGNGAWDAGTDLVFTFGQAGDLPVAGDWNGDGIDQIGVFRAGKWYLDGNGNGAWDAGPDLVFTFGQANDLPVAGDWNGDGADQIGVYRAGKWYLDGNGNGAWDAGPDLVFTFGQAGDLPVAGDWNGDVADQIGVYRAGKWYLDGNGNGAWDAGTDLVFTFGQADDLPVAGAW